MTEVRKQEHEDVAHLPEGFKMTELGALPEEWEVVSFGDVLSLPEVRSTKVLTMARCL